MYRADWTALSLAAEVAEFEDFSAYMRMTQPSRPDWMPRTGPYQRGWPGRPADRQRSEPQRDDAGGDEFDADESDADEPGVDAETADEDLGQSGAVREQRLRLLLGPGGRFRTEADSSRGSDSRLPPAGPPCPELLCPAWLPASFELELAGPAVCAGRPAHRVIGRPRPAGRGRRRGSPPVPRPGHWGQLMRRDQPGAASRIDALVDAELGILLRCEQLHDGEVVSRREISSLILDPPEAHDAAQFADPVDPADPTDQSGPGPFAGPGWERAKTAASLGATALSYAVRYSPRREPPPGSQPGGPPAVPARPGDCAGHPEPDEPVSAELVTLLYEAGLRRTGFDAELRTWHDGTTVADGLAAATRDSGLAGVRRLAGALGARARRARHKLAEPGSHQDRPPGPLPHRIPRWRHPPSAEHGRRLRRLAAVAGLSRPRQCGPGPSAAGAGCVTG
jgi:hypothetical protein